jgi:hypothetical protein
MDKVLKQDSSKLITLNLQISLYMKMTALRDTAPCRCSMNV